MNTTLPSCLRPELATIALLLIGCLTASPVMAETRYIKPNLEITLRRAQNTTSKAVATVPMGAPVELVKGGREWSLIRLQDATEGWIRNRFLSSSPLLPVGNFKGAPGLDGTPADAQARFKDWTDENGRLRKELAACTTDRSTLADKYQTLVGDPDSVLHTKTSLGEAQQQIEELQAKLATAQIENTVLKKNESIKWFLVGGCVLLLGWLIGRLSGNSRKKRPSLL